MTKQEQILDKRRLRFGMHQDNIQSEVIEAMDEWAKQQSIAFFKWYADKMVAFIEYITKIRPMVVSEEIEERIREHEGATFEQLYDRFIASQPTTNTDTK